MKCLNTFPWVILSVLHAGVSVIAPWVWVGKLRHSVEEYSNNTIERSWAADSPARVPCPDRILRERGRMPSAPLSRLLTPSQPQVVLTSSPEMFWLISELPRWHCWLYLSYLLLSHAVGTSLWECGNPVPALHPLYPSVYMVRGALVLLLEALGHR